MITAMMTTLENINPKIAFLFSGVVMALTSGEALETAVNMSLSNADIIELLKILPPLLAAGGAFLTGYSQYLKAKNKDDDNGNKD
jgi:hypothetical protein